MYLILALSCGSSVLSVLFGILIFAFPGDYPIHIVVKNGRITLLGVVDSEQDKIVAGMKARQVPGAFAVENELMVDSDQKSTRK